MTESERKIVEYQAHREIVWNARGIFRCEEKIKGEKECPKQCFECNQYYVNKLIADK